MKNNVIAELVALKTMNASELRDKWKKLMDGDPPTMNRTYLESRLAHRIQTLAYGGISHETERRLQQLRENLTTGSPLKPRDTGKPPIGAVLVREHGGVEHRVKVIKDGFEYNGRVWKSLTAVASHIAGVHWNGPMFFGLRRKG